MREKKVRAWDKVTETYLYSDKFPSMWQFYKELENRGIRHYETEDYIGLKDENGKEIYEGDIYRQSWKGEEVMGKIVYEDGYMARYWLEPSPHYRIGQIKITGKVIGNIYEGIKEDKE